MLVGCFEKRDCGPLEIILECYWKVFHVHRLEVMGVCRQGKSRHPLWQYVW